MYRFHLEFEKEKKEEGRVRITKQTRRKQSCPVLEVKVQQAMPLWLTALLDAGGIRKASFSKYGEAFRQQLLGTRIAG